MWKNPHMPVHGDSSLSKRENQAMEIVYRLGSATAAEIQAELPDAPAYSSVRSLLSILVDKQLLKYRQEGRRYIYEAAKSSTRIRKQAVTRLLNTFFGSSPRELVANLLDPRENRLSEKDVADLRQLLDQHPHQPS